MRGSLYLFRIENQFSKTSSVGQVTILQLQFHGLLSFSVCVFIFSAVRLRRFFLTRLFLSITLLLRIFFLSEKLDKLLVSHGLLRLQGAF